MTILTYSDFYWTTSNNIKILVIIGSLKCTRKGFTMINKKNIPEGIFLIILSSLLFLTSCTSGNTFQDTAPVISLNDIKPNPELTPADVVRIQLTAFKENNSEDQGIALAYRFASPRNKKITGNVDNFASMIRRDPYRPMLYNANFELGPVDERGTLAIVAVRVDQSDDSSRGYLFVLTRQDGGEYDNCWLTDGVIQIDIERISDQSPIVTINT